VNANYVIEYLKKSNKHLEETLVDGFVTETTIRYFPLYFFEYFSMNVDAQKKFLELSDNNLKTLSLIISYAEKMNQDWVPLCGEFYHFLNNKRYSNLVDDMSNKIIEQSLIENLLFLCKDGGNYFKIDSVEELTNLDSIRLEKNNKNNNTNDPNILLLNKYGISYDKTFNLYKRYGKDVENFKETYEKEFLLDIKNIIEGKGTEKSVYEDKSFIINVDSNLRNYFSKIYNEIFYTFDENKKIGNIDGIDIYDAGLDFNMCIYSYGMATEYSIPENYKRDWNRPDISTDYMCNSIINSCNIHTSLKHCIYGFSHIERNELALLASNDLGTGGIYKDINITNPFYEKKLISDVEFRTPSELINNTRLTNNELYRSRRRLVDGMLERINPDYIVYLKKEENFENDPIWNESKNAAKDFNIPIVMIDCKKCLLDNINKIENNVELFESRYDDSKILVKIIEMMNTLDSGYKHVAPDLVEKYFNKAERRFYFERVMKHIDKISENAPRTAVDCIDIILNTLDSEFEKMLKSPYWVEQVRKKGEEIEKPNDVIILLEEKKIELKEKSNYDNEIYQMFR